MSKSSSLSESVVVGVVGEIVCAGVSPAKRGRPARGKVVREVDWLSGLSSGVEVEVREELELVVVSPEKKSGGAGVSPAKKAEALAAKETKKAEAFLESETVKIVLAVICLLLLIFIII